MRLLCAVSLLGHAALAARITPVQQVITMLEEMKVKGQSALDEEVSVFKTYTKWMEKRIQELGFEMTTEKSLIEKLTATIEKLSTDSSTLSKEIAELDDSIATAEADKKESTEIREKQHSIYLTSSKDLSESVDALKRAIETLSAQDYDRPEAEMLLQKMAKATPPLRQVVALLEEKQQSAGAPAVASYKFQSSTILQVLEDLLDKFKAQLSEVEEAESNEAHEFDVEKLHLTNMLTGFNADRAEKAATKGEKLAAKATAEKELASTKSDLKANQDLSAEIESTYRVKAAAYTENQKVRADELTALSQALDILKAPEVSSSYAEHINLAQVASKSLSFLQVQTSKSGAVAREHAAKFLQRKAAALSSRTLAEFASKVADNPFAKVITMIEDLLAKLKAEASAEADHKAWCDKELKANKLKRNKKTEEQGKLTAEIGELTADIDSMAKEISSLVDEQEKLTQAMKEATEVRTKENAENVDTIADAKAGEEAVKKALAIIREFYASQGSFMQTRQVPEMAAYKGLQGEKKGVVGMLEVIASDFARLAAETTASEEQAAREYKSFMEKSEATKEERHKTEVQVRLDKDDAEFNKERKEKILAAVEEELAKANEYYSYLKPNCLQVHVSYEERVAKREEEIAALKEAYGILDQKPSE